MRPWPTRPVSPSPSTTRIWRWCATARTISLVKGENDVAFVDVSAQIRPQTALLKSSAGPLDVLEQNFDFDLLTPEKLLEKSVGSMVRVIRLDPDSGDEVVQEARVLSVANGVVLQIGDRIETNVPGRIVFSEVPANLRSRPTLVTKLDSAMEGRVPVELAYLTGGLGWSADYVAELSPDESTIELKGWVTLTNTSGTAYRNAKLQLVAGNVNQVRQAMDMQMKAATMVAEAAGAAHDRAGDVRISPLYARAADQHRGEPDQAGRAADRPWRAGA